MQIQKISKTVLTFQILFPKFITTSSELVLEELKVFLEFLIFSPLFSTHKYLKICSKARLKNSFYGWINLLLKGKPKEEQSNETDEKKVQTQGEKRREDLFQTYG